ncbi:CDP-diacylglycerol--inositol 3-phosphatidyltransferase 1 [Dichanthelium oligosanthes]|uniref:CDP-diacylglycerol--inositol 3-phosphatidyltransferase 1 n=1 Tax=Dichanthelium oligosanthes TaxID=888268 RepID=A0A1E5VNI9_9POAL|nr:CDP-diacylglycerol--inositol 3-phosphatidyltransferase 1 [Dichanthelium oligosanthes]
MPSVYLYIPNIIGYFRIIINFIAFAVCYSNKALFAILYFISFVLDGVDGWFARKFNQASTFGAVLDMVTDRVSTACLLALLSQFYRPGLVFLILLGLDITSHWFQMYRSVFSTIYFSSCKLLVCFSSQHLILFLSQHIQQAFTQLTKESLYVSPSDLFLLPNFTGMQKYSESKSPHCLGVYFHSSWLGSETSYQCHPGIHLNFATARCYLHICWNCGTTRDMKTAADACCVYDLKRSK